MLRLLLFPFAILYDLVTRVRNYLYDIGHKSSFSFEVPVISVGNLNAGGSGKTPMVEYLIRLTMNTRKVATLSRGYGRRTKGYRLATNEDNASTLGDEPFQYFKKFGGRVKVTVGEDRAFAIPNILNEEGETDLIILDDAFQHRSVRPGLSILLTEYAHPFTSDFVLPAGNLRESRRGARRADVVVVTKCPADMANEESLTSSIRRYAGDKPVFFTRIDYASPTCFGKSHPIGKKIILVTGIARPDPMSSYLKNNFEVLRHFRFADHHAFSLGDLKEIHSFAAEHTDAVIITTEKDMVRLIQPALIDEVSNHPWYYLPISVNFLKNGADFDNLVRQFLN